MTLPRLKFKTRLIPIIFLLLFLGSSVASQQVTVAVNNNLAFGNVLPGSEKVIDKTAAGSAAEFLLSGPAGREVTIQFNLPLFLKLGGNNMLVSFSITDLSMDSSVNQASNQATPGHDNLDPNVVTTYGVGANGLTIWLGGKAIPANGQAAGSYSSSLIIIVDTTII